MLRKLNSPRNLLIPFFILLLSISVFLSLSAPSGAQQISCPGNLLKNGDFSVYTINNGNSNFPPSAVGDWSAGFLSPQIVTAPTVPGCDGKPGFIAMWGNKAVGEGVRQANLNIQAGHTYRLSACVKVDVTNQALPKYVRFHVRASNGAFSYFPSTSTAPTIGIIGDASNTAVSNPQGITSTTWTQVTMANWTATGNFNTLTINPENDNTGDGTTVSWGHLDDVCLTEVFPVEFPTPSPVCVGQPMPFTSNVAGASSWNWNFGDGTPNSNQQNPSHTYTTAGTFNVTLCVNGTTNCVTKPITIKAAPPVPVITGPSSSCGNQNATYSVPAVPGVAYAWTVNNGTINGSSTGPSVNVTWNPNGGGSISVTVTNKGGCSSTARIVVTDCDLHQGECCHALQSKTDLQSFVHTGNGLYNFTATLSVSMPNITRVTADIISSSVTYAPASCGKAGPVTSYMTGASNVGSFSAAIPVTNGDLAIWWGPPTNVGGINFPMQIKFPPPPSGGCTDFLTFCVRYTFTDNKCKTCEVIRCYGPFKRSGKIIDVFDDVKDKTERARP